MKTEWKLDFKAYGITFPKRSRFTGNLLPPYEADPRIDFTLEILSDREKTDLKSDATGQFVITLPGSAEDSEPFMFIALTQIKAKLEFPDRRIEIDGGGVFYKIITETAAEEEAVGDAIYGYNLRLVEEPVQLPHFDPQQLVQSLPAQELAIMAQFNQASQANPIDKFLGFFKILEKVYADTRGCDVLRTMKANNQLWKLAERTLKVRNEGGFSRDDFNELLTCIYRTRDQCAHLRGRTGFLPGDSRIVQVVEPHLNLVRALAERTISRI
jgi:hypothetical protein